MKIRRKLYTVETVSSLKSKAKFRRAYERCRADQTAINDEMIAAGRGHWRNAERDAAAKAGDELALLDQALTSEAYYLGWHAERWFGQPPYMV